MKDAFAVLYVRQILFLKSIKIWPTFCALWQSSEESKKKTLDSPGSQLELFVGEEVQAKHRPKI